MAAAAPISNKRLAKEASKWANSQDQVGELEVVSENEWIVTFEGAVDTLYAGEVYRLRLQFPKKYPMDSPIVTFVAPAPVHPHIYSNGHICLSILYGERGARVTGVTGIMVGSSSRSSSSSSSSHYQQRK